jgi:hypothetical protein
MSDGVWKFAGWERILSMSALQPGTELVDSVYQSAKLLKSKSLQDDFTLVLIKALST